jgi:hypothetical protein
MLLESLIAIALVQRPKPAAKPHLDKIDWALIATDASVRALDTYSTRWMLDNGNRELFLPKFVANHTPVLAATEGAAVAGNILAARILEHHHHGKLAKLALSIDIAGDAPWAIHNLYLPKGKK